MHCWLALHYPHYPVDDAEWCIYVRRGHEHKVSAFGKGDRVAIYEVMKGPDRLGKGKRPRGRGGVVCIALGAGPARESAFGEAYVGGVRVEFALECPCEQHMHQHLLKREEMFDALGRRVNLHGLGGGAGFVNVPCEEFDGLERAFLLSPAD